MRAADLQKISNTILSNYEKCNEQVKLAVNSITLSWNEIT